MENRVQMGVPQQRGVALLLFVLGVVLDAVGLYFVAIALFTIVTERHLLGNHAMGLTGSVLGAALLFAGTKAIVSATAKWKGEPSK